MTNTLVTTYNNPDIDGIASALAYQEFLTRTGKDATARIYGQPDPEAHLVLKECNSTIRNDIPRHDAIILVDTTKLPPDALSKDNVTEIIDHRRDHNAHKYPNAKAQIEPVGAAATLITEHFQEQHITPHDTTAQLLHTAIHDNTASFNADVTTKRDENATRWLETQANIDPTLIDKVYREKSTIDTPVQKAIHTDYYTTTYNDTTIGVSQFELLNINELLQHKQEITDALHHISDEHQLDHIFITAADITDAHTTLITPHPHTQDLLETTFPITFNNDTAQFNTLKLRKQLMPAIKTALTH